ncbi:hypothetical protein BS78_05G090500 [Paspalum vaginatum]|nr:hypothetical protein BS78_05G090500 [Paspalum vaginatum]
MHIQRSTASYQWIDTETDRGRGLQSRLSHFPRPHRRRRIRRRLSRPSFGQHRRSSKWRPAASRTQVTESCGFFLDGARRPPEPAPSRPKPRRAARRPPPPRATRRTLAACSRTSFRLSSPLSGLPSLAASGQAATSMKPRDGLLAPEPRPPWRPSRMGTVSACACGGEASVAHPRLLVGARRSSRSSGTVVGRDKRRLGAQRGDGVPDEVDKCVAHAGCPRHGLERGGVRRLRTRARGAL